MRIYRIADKQFHYLGQCDKLRCNHIGEGNWQNMIKNHIEISEEEFVDNCATEELLDEDEPLWEFMGADPTSYFAKSLWGDKPCYYLMTAGFEFIFT